MTAPPVGTISYVVAVLHDYLCNYTGCSAGHPPGVLPEEVRVATEVPADRPPLLVIITTASTGAGAHSDVLSWRRVTLYCSAPDELVAGRLAETVFGWLRSAEQEKQAGRQLQGTGFRCVNVVGTPARLDDPDDSTPRFQMTVDVLLRTVFQPI
jgi:hypothetical protein